MASAYLISVTGLPVGLQLVGRRRGDWDLLALGHQFEAATGYSAITPIAAPPSAVRRTLDPREV